MSMHSMQTMQTTHRKRREIQKGAEAPDAEDEEQTKADETAENEKSDDDSQPETKQSSVDAQGYLLLQGWPTNQITQVTGSLLAVAYYRDTRDTNKDAYKLQLCDGIVADFRDLNFRSSKPVPSKPVSLENGKLRWQISTLQRATKGDDLDCGVAFDEKRAYVVTKLDDAEQLTFRDYKFVRSYFVHDAANVLPPQTHPEPPVFTAVPTWLILYSENIFAVAYFSLGTDIEWDVKVSDKNVAYIQETKRDVRDPKAKPWDDQFFKATGTIAGADFAACVEADAESQTVWNDCVGLAKHGSDALMVYRAMTTEKALFRWDDKPWTPVFYCHQIEKSVTLSNGQPMENSD